MNAFATIGAYHFGGGGTVDWLVHMVVGSIINGLIFGLIFRLLSHLSTGEAVLLAVVVIGGMFLWARNRDQRRF